MKLEIKLLKIASKYKGSNYLYLFQDESLKNNSLKEIRSSLSRDYNIYKVKKSILLKRLSKELNSSLILPKGQIYILETNTISDIEEISKLEQLRLNTFYKINSPIKNDVILLKGNSGRRQSEKLRYLDGLGCINLDKGVINIKQECQILTKNEKMSAPASRALDYLQLRLKENKLELLGLVFKGLFISKENLFKFSLQSFIEISNVLSLLQVKLNLPTITNIMYNINVNLIIFNEISKIINSRGEIIYE